MIVRVRKCRHGEKIVPRALPRHLIDAGDGTVVYADAQRVNAIVAVWKNRAADDDLGNVLLHVRASVVTAKRLDRETIHRPRRSDSIQDAKLLKHRHLLIEANFSLASR
jgi:hypothetical protein